MIHRDDFMTATIQPPALAFAWRVAVGDPALEPRIVAHHKAITVERDLEGDGLLWILQPDESGLDASPQFDPIWGHRAQGLPGFVELVRRNREREFRIEAVRADGDPVVCEVMTNVIHGLSRLALGLPSITPALIARCYDEPSGLFLPAVTPTISVRIPLTVAALSPLALPDLPDEIGHRLAEYLLDEQRFWTAVARTVGGARRAFVLAAGALRRTATVLAGADLDQQRVAAVARTRAPRLRGGGGHARPGDHRNGVAGGPAGVLRSPRRARDGRRGLRLVRARARAARPRQRKPRRPWVSALCLIAPPARPSTRRSTPEHQNRLALGDAKKHLRKSAIKLVGYLVAAYLVLRLIPTLEQALHSLAHVSWEWIVGAIATEVVSETGFVISWRGVVDPERVLERDGRGRRMDQRVAWAQLGGGPLPGGTLGGIGVGAWFLHRFGMPPKQIAERQFNLSFLNTAVSALALIVFGIGLATGLCPARTTSC